MAARFEGGLHWRMGFDGDIGAVAFVGVVGHLQFRSPRRGRGVCECEGEAGEGLCRGLGEGDGTGSVLNGG